MNQYKQGDIVVHIKNDRKHSGAGFKLNEIWEVGDRDRNYSTDVVWTHTGCGVYPEEVRYASPEEIQWFLQGNSSITNMPKTTNYEIY